MQLPARAPTMAAMTAMSLDQLSGGRFIVGLGPSGSAGRRGLVRRVVRQAADAPARVHRDHAPGVRARGAASSTTACTTSLPYTGPDGTGLGKPLKSILHCERKIPIYTASLQPKAVAMSAELCDGFFPVVDEPRALRHLRGPRSRRGWPRPAAARALADFDVAPFVTVVMGDDVEQCRMPVKAMLALYIGGMGARDKNFYNDYATQLGYGDAARKIQDLYLAGKKDEAMAAGARPARRRHRAGAGRATASRITMQRWIEAGKKHHVGSMLLGTRQPEALQLMAELVL